MLLIKYTLELCNAETPIEYTVLFAELPVKRRNPQDIMQERLNFELSLQIINLDNTLVAVERNGGTIHSKSAITTIKKNKMYFQDFYTGGVDIELIRLE